MIPNLLLTYANINMNPQDEKSFEKQNTKKIAYMYRTTLENIIHLHKG